jgi:hypothetical protein
MPHDSVYAAPQPQFNFVNMTPLALMYLLSIFNGDFDKRLHMGHFVTNENFAKRVRDLMDMGFIAYDGRHCINPLGAAYIESLLQHPLK